MIFLCYADLFDILWYPYKRINESRSLINVWQYSYWCCFVTTQRSGIATEISKLYQSNFFVFFLNRFIFCHFVYIKTCLFNVVQIINKLLNNKYKVLTLYSWAATVKLIFSTKEDTGEVGRKMIFPYTLRPSFSKSNMPGHGDDEYWPHTKLKLKIRTHKHTSFKSIFLIYELRFAFCDLNLFVLVRSQRRVSMPPIGEGLAILSRWMRHTKQIFRIVLVVRRLLNFLFYCGMSRTVVLTWCQVDTFVRVNIIMYGRCGYN